MSVFLLPKSAKVWSSISTRSFNRLRSVNTRPFSTSYPILNSDKSNKNGKDSIDISNDETYQQLDPSKRNYLERQQKTLQKEWEDYGIKIPKLIAPEYSEEGDEVLNEMDVGTFSGKTRRLQGDFANSSLKTGIEREIEKAGDLPKYDQELVGRVDELLDFYGVEEKKSSLTPEDFLVSFEDQLHYLSSPKESPLYKFISKVDKPFADKFLDEKITAEELLAHIQDEKNHLTKVINGSSPQELTELEKLLFAGVQVSPSVAFLNSLEEALADTGKIEESEVYKVISELDAKFAESLTDSNSTFESLVEYLEDKRHPFSKVLSNQSSEEYQRLESVFSEAQGSLAPSKSFLIALEAYADEHTDLKNTELFDYIAALDEKFAKLLEQPETERHQLVEYLENEKNIISAVIHDDTCDEFSKIQELLLEEVDQTAGDALLKNIVKVLKESENLESSFLYQKLAEIDPEFAQLVQESKKEELSQYLESENAKIKNVLVDPESPEFKALEEEVEVASRIVSKPAENISLTEVIDYHLSIFSSPDKSTIFNKVIRIIDPTLSVLLEDYALVMANAEKADIDVQEKNELMNEIVNYIDDPHNENVYDAFHREGSFSNTLLVKLLAEKPAKRILISPEEEATTDITKAAELLKLEDADKIELQYKKEKLKNLNSKIADLLEEDQNGLDESTKLSNETFDLFIETMTDLQKEFEVKGVEKVSEAEKKENMKYFTEITNSVSSEQLKEKRESNIEGKFVRTTNKDRILNLCVNIMMRKGKKEVARRNLNRALYLIYLEKRTNPAELFKNALDLLAPLVSTKTTQQAFSARRTVVPVPLTEKKRFRMAFLWILEASDNRASSDFAVRLSEEILSVSTGTSPLMEKKHLNHKTAMINRSYLKVNKSK